MPLTSGQRIGAYEVVCLLGAGGMGEVYRARDPRLKREVAIKVLPALLSSDPERMARFEREAQSLAALNHPHIAAIYGFEDFANVRGLVMELVEGPTLADRISQGAVPLAESLRYAKEIAAALDAAHEKGIIHRDLKPANIKLSADGEIKVLDFGLAKAVQPDSGASQQISTSPTLTARATELGIILGTGAYMAPEQARGKPVDKRADIWGFGCVLFELLTGKRAFEGDEITDVLARVIEREPDWSQLPAATPPALRTLLQRCLTKDPKARMRDIGDARFAISEIEDAAGRSGPSVAQSADTPSAPIARRESRLPRLVPWAIAAIATTVAIAMALPRSGTTPAAEPTRVELTLPPDVELFGKPDISADGRTVAFVGVREGVRQVYVRRMDRAEALVVPGTDGTASVSIAPDGQTGAIVGTDTKLKRVTFASGMVEPLLTSADFLGGSCVARDGSILFVQGAKLMMLPQGATAPRALATVNPQADEVSLVAPVVTESGKHALFTVRYGKPGQLRLRVAMVPMAGGTHQVITETADQALAVMSGRIVLARDNALLVTDFDEMNGKLVGQANRIAEDVLVGATGVIAASVSHTGTVLYAGNRLASSYLVWVDPTGAEHVVAGPPRVYQNPRVSPDGRQIAFAANGTVWTMDPLRGGVTRVTPNSTDATMGFPTWTSDSSRIFLRSRDGIVLQRADAEGSPRPIKGTNAADYPSSVTPDGKTLLFLRISAESAGDIYTATIETGELKPIVATPAYEGAPQVSPDGRWLAYVSNHSGPMEVYLRQLEGGDRRWAVSSGGGLHPLWSRDGKQIYYRFGQKLLSVDVTTTPEVRLGTPKLILERRYEFGVNLTFPNYSLSHDGRQFLMVKSIEGSSHFNLVMNWIR